MRNIQCKKFIIVSTRQRSGGAIVLHSLCKSLTQLGYDASIYYIGETQYLNSKHYRFWMKQVWFIFKDQLRIFLSSMFSGKILKRFKCFDGYIDVSIKGCRCVVFPKIDKNTIVVYPDIVFGNFFHAKNVVRWLLYYNRYDYSSYGKDDLFYAFREEFNDLNLNPEKNILNIAHFDLELYRKYNYEKRHGKCYVIRKGKDRDDLPNKFDGIVIDDLSEKEKVKVLNISEYCICYDTQTAYSTIAAICGCISIVVPEKGKTWRDYRTSEEEKYGQAFGFDQEEINWAIRTTPKALERYENYNKNGLENVEKFAIKCAEYFGIES